MNKNDSDEYIHHYYLLFIVYHQYLGVKIHQITQGTDDKLLFIIYSLSSSGPLRSK